MTRDTAVQKEDKRQAIVSPVRFSKSTDQQAIITHISWMYEGLITDKGRY